MKAYSKKFWKLKELHFGWETTTPLLGVIFDSAESTKKDTYFLLYLYLYREESEIWNLLKIFLKKI